MSAKAEKAEGGDKAEGAGKKKLPLPLIVGVVVLILGIFIGKSVLGGSKKEHKSEKVKEEVGVSLALDEFMVNLDGGGEHYLRAQISLGLRKGLTEEEAKEHVAPMRDAILSVLRSKSLAQVTKPKDIEALKDELKIKINAATSEDKDKDKEDKDDKEKDDKDKDDKDKKHTVVKVYFTAFATQ